MGDRKIFVPVRGTEAKISAAVMGFHDGYLYFATDTGRIYLDYINEDGQLVARAMVGNSAGGGAGNSGIYYANYVLSAEEKLDTSIRFPINAIEGDDYPLKDDLIINISEGSFYRVVNPSPLTSSVEAMRLTISGGSGGTSSLAEDIDLTIEPLSNVSLINGQSALVYFTATSAKNNKGNEIDSQLTITYTLAYTEDNTNYTTYLTDKFTVNSGERSSFDFGQFARYSSSSKLTLRASLPNHESTINRSVEFSTSNLELTLGSTFNPSSYFSPNDLILSCNAIGNMNKIIEYYFDNMTVPFYTENLRPSDAVARSIKVSEKGGNKVSLTHGNHKIAIRLFLSVNGEKGLEVAPLIFEVGIVKGGETAPVIWLGDYKDIYYSYDVILIPFRVYDPLSPTAAVVHFKKNNRELINSPLTITEFNKFSYFEIADAELNTLNHYSITCGENANETARDIEFRVEVDPNRTEFHIQEPDYLTYLLDTVGSGRSNNEPEAKRQTLVYAPEGKTPIAATLSNFNWYNNGWVRDEETNRTCLRISNGAKLSIPIGLMTFAGTTGGEETHTIELLFKVRNVQDYSNLIRNITRYKGDEDLFRLFYDNNTYQTKYTNYDSFLTAYLRDNVVYQSDGVTRLEYDDLEFARIQKQINLSNTFCLYYKNGIGLCLGPQDMFFSNGSNTVSASYVEDLIVSVSIVYLHSATVASQRLIMIYINGILTSVILNTNSEEFTIQSDSIVFNSDMCDIDLYKIRVYNTSLNVNNIIMNYAVDFANVDIYDQNKLALYNSNIKEYYFDYDEMIKYNATHPNDPLMPYIVFDTAYNNKIADLKLSYAKSVQLRIGVEFVNTGLDLAYASGELEQLAKEDHLWDNNSTPEEKAEAIKTYYLYHCPSFIGDNINMAVQGTSSEFYPRRNYKLKTKTNDSDGESRVHIFLNRGPFKAIYDADQEGLKLKKYVLSNAAYNPSLTYYSDEEGTTSVTFDNNNPYRYNTYYIKNPNYVEFGKEKSRLKYWYMNNYTAGTTKFTMKIDYMESSGSYNMGFANLVKNGYSKHPLDDYNSAGAFVTENINYTIADSYSEGTTYAYLDARKKWQTISLATEEDFNLGPVGYAATQENMSVLSTNNYWYDVDKTYPTCTIYRTNDYRTSVGGFRVLAFHKKLYQDGTTHYQYIGMYNMLLDKGSDEVYGFKLDKTARSSTELNAPLISPLLKFLKNKKISKIAECWEMENNSRTYCSFRDPDKRKDLSFDCFDIKSGLKVRRLNSVGSVPIVADSFEYRYHTDADILDYVMDPDKNANKYDSEDTLAYIEKNGDLKFFDNNKAENQDNRANFLLDRYKNWEKACLWVWSTCTDYVPSQGQYEEITIGDTLWGSEPIYLKIDELNYELYQGDLDISLTYYKQIIKDGITSYIVAHVVTDPLYVFTDTNKNNFYILVNNSYVTCANEPEFNDSILYYTLINYNDELMAEAERQGRVDRLVRKTTADDVFDSNETYYTYDGSLTNGHATQVVSNDIVATDFDAKKGTDDAYYVGITITYRNKSYKYDTIEYRGDKFINELALHFDLEYMATYFVMTEVFECYDSRGKNCMMASWGPQAQGGEYIWYPIFYDIDTQLGVNNTGIPSFEYNVDATEDGNYSTSDSVLWNNFYKYFKSSAILAKYKHLRKVTAGVSWTQLENPPLVNVDNIEKWYNTDPNVCNNLAMRGKRPIVAKNLDEYYKYITITNGSNLEALDNGLIGHLASNTSGDQVVDLGGQYFYMLQGDRSLSRRQFLTNRLEYIDSWLNQGNYQRGGNNLIRGRVSANNHDTSDEWIETANDPYYLDPEETIKSHLFDAEYWLTLTPTHSSYVTLGDDNEAYPSQKYDGINPLKFKINAIEQGVRTSPGYPEQLLYVYGINHMSDLGDMSKLYWREFSISGSAEKLTSLKFGYDGVMTENGRTIYYKNEGVNNFSIGAGKPQDSTAKGLPLLKYLNLSNVKLSPSASTTVLDLTSCEKLENLRATYSNFTEFLFADGVALNTLYLPSTLTTLKLTEVRLLKNLITEYHDPELVDGDLVADPGLYLEGMFEGQGSTEIATLNIFGSGLGYDSYKLLKRYYDIRSRENKESFILMTNVQWSPYVLVEEEEAWDEHSTYYMDNGHYGLEEYVYNSRTWKTLTANKEIYRVNSDILPEVISLINDSTLDMLTVFADDSNDSLFKTSARINIPNITGLIYIENTNSVDEVEIRNGLAKKFPGLTFFFANVEEAYTAKFVVMDEDTGESGTYTLIGSLTIDPDLVLQVQPGEDYDSSLTYYLNEECTIAYTYNTSTWQAAIAEGLYYKRQWFSNPIKLYGDISDRKPNYDFYGWGTKNSMDDLVISLDGTDSEWRGMHLESNIHTYYFYAICTIHKWTVNVYDNGVQIDSLLIPHMSYFTGPSMAPYKDDSALPLTETYLLLGYARSANATEPIEDLKQVPIIGDTNFYTVWKDEPVSVFDNIHPEYFEIKKTYSHIENNDVGDSAYNIDGVGVVLKVPVRGKLTIPNYITVEEMVNEQPTLVTYNITLVTTKKTLSTSSGGLTEDPNYENVTHIFFEKDDNGNTSVRSIDGFVFAGCTNLSYFEFSAPGLRMLGTRTFQKVRNLVLSTLISGTIFSLGTSTFLNAFGTIPDNTLFLVDGNVTNASASSFRNQDSTFFHASNMTFLFGSSKKPCKLQSIIGGEGINSINKSDDAACYNLFIMNNGNHLNANKVIIYVENEATITSRFSSEAGWQDKLLRYLCFDQADTIIDTLGLARPLSDFIELILSNATNN